MASINVPIHLQKRPAIYKPNKYRAHALGVPAGTEFLVGVFGIFQYADEEEAGPVFAIEYDDGTCGCAAVEEISFMDRGECVC